jgi:hypothetical protein
MGHPGISERADRQTTQGQWSVDRMLALIGRAPGCKVRLCDPQAAAIHASLLCTSQEIWVIDLGGPGGIAVNAQKVRVARLEDGDLLSIAGFAVRVCCRTTTSYPLRLPPREAGHNGQGSALIRLEADLRPPDVSRSLVPASHLPALGDAHSARAMLESILVPLVQQFSAMQNQMFDQFQQAMATAFQMVALQKDQMELIRQEWIRVQELNVEIQALRAEMQKQPAAAPAPVEKEAPDKLEPVYDTLLAQSATVPSELCPDGEKLGPEIHSWLCQRMTELQEDQRGRWQKILGFLTGK